MKKTFADLLDDYLQAREVVQRAFEEYHGNSFGYDYEGEVTAKQEARTALDGFFEDNLSPEAPKTDTTISDVDSHEVYRRLQNLSTFLESPGRIHEQDHPWIYEAVLEAMYIVRRFDMFRETLEKIASCESHHPGDVVAIARDALA